MLTIKEVARMAGVSVSTVSKVLNHYTGVKPETRENVLRVVRQTHFVPNRSARRLVQKNGMTIGFIMSGVESVNRNDYMQMQLLKGAFQYAQNTPYDFVFLPTNTALQRQRSYMQLCRENNLAGVVMCGLRFDDPYYTEASASALPCVTIDFSLPGERHSSILVNNLEATHCAMEYLIRQGHREIGFVNGNEASVVGVERCTGYRQSLEAHELPLHPPYIVYGDFKEETAYAESRRLLTAQPQITALFCASDVMALGVYRAAADLSRKIPEDLSLVAFDDIPMAAYLRPPLTTLRQHFDRVGYDAAKLLVHILQKPGETCPPRYSTFELIVRGSVKTRPPG